ncbi:hypothetical protein C5167_021350 [Papaver somniferum]|uniref:Uncharacterized protein n=1 Tax=Papaver somniferum TaxID=3469 RepID=A0A4Y7IZK4_PAPSO|nr:hypothetical protein C5167_021350 [Papaver somniferum]
MAYMETVASPLFVEDNMSQYDDMDYMGGDYEMDDVEDDMDEEFHGRGLGVDSDDGDQLAIDAIDDTDIPPRHVNNTGLSARVGRINLDWVDPDQSSE